jgi:SP family general alpha glucoside:H+ symporter-like MFS transporter
VYHFHANSLANVSRRWLVRKGRTEDARHALKKLQAKGADENELDATVAMISYTHKFEKDSEISASYLDCFKGVDLRRTEITCMVWAIQNLSGSGFMGYSTYFFQQAGLNSKNSFNIAMAQYGIGAIGTIWFLMARFGRRTLYLAGLTFQFIVLLITGFLGLASSSNAAVPWVVACMMIAYTFVYDMTVGPVCYALVPEIPSGRLRTRTVVLGRNLYNIINIIMNIIIPYMLNPTAWNWKAKAGFFYAGLCFLCGVWAFFRLPEPKGRTYAELDQLFERGVPARKFKSTSVEVFNTHITLGHDNNVVSEKEHEATRIEHVDMK